MNTLLYAENDAYPCPETFPTDEMSSLCFSVGNTYLYSTESYTIFFKLTSHARLSSWCWSPVDRTETPNLNLLREDKSSQGKVCVYQSEEPLIVPKTKEPRVDFEVLIFHAREND